MYRCEECSCLLPNEEAYLRCRKNHDDARAVRMRQKTCQHEWGEPYLDAPDSYSAFRVCQKCGSHQSMPIAIVIRRGLRQLTDEDWS